MEMIIIVTKVWSIIMALHWIRNSHHIQMFTFYTVSKWIQHSTVCFILIFVWFMLRNNFIRNTTQHNETETNVNWPSSIGNIVFGFLIDCCSMFKWFASHAFECDLNQAVTSSSFWIFYFCFIFRYSKVFAFENCQNKLWLFCFAVCRKSIPHKWLHIKIWKCSNIN